MYEQAARDVAFYCDFMTPPETDEEVLCVADAIHANKFPDGELLRLRMHKVREERPNASAIDGATLRPSTCLRCGTVTTREARHTNRWCKCGAKWEIPPPEFELVWIANFPPVLRLIN